MNYTTLLLSEEQMKFLESKKYGIDRIECFRYFLHNAVTSDSIVRVIDLDIQLKVGQCVCSKVQLAKLWKVDRKTVISILADFKRYQLVSSEENYRTTVHTLLCVPEFEENGEQHINTFFQKYDPELNVKKARSTMTKKDKALLSKENVPEVHEEVMKTESTDSQSEVEEKSTHIPPTTIAKEEEKVHTPASKTRITRTRNLRGTKSRRTETPKKQMERITKRWICSQEQSLPTLILREYIKVAMRPKPVRVFVFNDVMTRYSAHADVSRARCGRSIKSRCGGTKRQNSTQMWKCTFLPFLPCI